MVACAAVVLGSGVIEILNRFPELFGTAVSVSRNGGTGAACETWNRTRGQGMGSTVLRRWLLQEVSSSKPAFCSPGGTALNVQGIAISQKRKRR